MNKFDTMMYGKLGLATLCYAVSFRLICGGVAQVIKARSKAIREARKSQPPPVIPRTRP